MSTGVDSGTMQLLISLAAVVIALAALVVSLWHASQMRMHQRLSVRPHLCLDYDFASSVPITVSLVNTGVGPAYLRSFALEVGGGFHQPTTHGWQAALTQLGLEQHQHVFYCLGGDTVFPAGSKEQLIAFVRPDFAPEARNQIRDALKRLTFRIQYASIYDEVFTVAGLSPGQFT